ncbi:hypothetical protein GP486_007580 [Trichoglossum hirsutum]|uniref:Uncharacterized protein n=1 Tax=Trichoglossum hirsutum TaxID=265104 RepID=A0A9P8I637_9PEZI|nr:hypothetical protein GP486_007580 [Trichoglossum hirsutum]
MEDDDRTPMNGAGTTPIAESAISSSGGLTPFAHASHLRSHRRGLPTSARTITPGGYPHTLPVIGETPVEATPRAPPRSVHRLPAGGALPLPTPVDSGSDKEKSDWPSGLRSHDRKDSHEKEVAEVPLTLSSARYDPTQKKDTSRKVSGDAEAKSPMTEIRNKNLPSPAQGAFTALKEESRSRNGSRDRKPDGLHIQWPPLEDIIRGQYISSPELSSAGHPQHRRSNTMSSVSSIASSLPGRGNNKSPPVACYSAGANPSPVMAGGRSIDQFISSLGEASYHAKKQQQQQQQQPPRDDSRRRHPSRDDRARAADEESLPSKARGRSHSRQRLRERDASESRGRSVTRYIKPAKRSPSSPVPMSPEDLTYSPREGHHDDERYYGGGAVVSPVSAVSESRRARERSRARTGVSATRSEASRRERHVESPAPPPLAGDQPRSRVGSRVNSRTTSRRASPDTKGDRLGRGRSKVRAEGPSIRSPSSPLPMSPQAKLYQQYSEEKEEELKVIREERQRSRSTSRRPSERGTSAVRESSVDDRRARDRSTSRRPRERGTSAVREVSPMYRRRRERSESRGRLAVIADRSALRRSKSERSLKREMAARELEERRKSLARRPSAPVIPHPVELSSGKYSSAAAGGRLDEYADAADFYRSPVLSEDLEREYMPRGHPVSPGSVGSGQTWGSGVVSPPTVSVGLPATPRAMRHPRYMNTDPNEREGIPAVPEVPENLIELPPPSVYAPQRRSVSAPIPDDSNSPAALPASLPTHPAFLHTLPPSSIGGGSSGGSSSGSSNRRRGLSPGGGEDRHVRKVGPGEAQPGTLGYDSRNNSPIYSGNPQIVRAGIQETMGAGKVAAVTVAATSPGNGGSNNNNNLVPPPPPPAPILPELQHLATPSTSPGGQTPPPPPPPNKYKPQHAHTSSSSSSGVGVINIGIEEDHTPVTGVPQPGHKNLQAVSGQTGQMGQMSQTSQTNQMGHTTGGGGGGHSRVRSVNESVSSRMLAAAERLRSVSRTRGKSPYAVSPQYESSPYESVPNLPFSERAERLPPQVIPKERHPMEVRAGYIEGGMI